MRRVRKIGLLGLFSELKTHLSNCVPGKTEKKTPCKPVVVVGRHSHIVVLIIRTFNILSLK